jgi:uncharacterized membrane protein
VLINEVVDLLFFFFDIIVFIIIFFVFICIIAKKVSGEMETGENNFLSQIQSFRQYIFVGSLSEYSEERKELQSSTSSSTSGFIV